MDLLRRRRILCGGVVLLVTAALVSTARAAEGTPIEIDVRGRTRPAVIERKPLYKKGA